MYSVGILSDYIGYKIESGGEGGEVSRNRKRKLSGIKITQKTSSNKKYMGGKNA